MLSEHRNGPIDKDESNTNRHTVFMVKGIFATGHGHDNMSGKMYTYT